MTNRRLWTEDCRERSLDSVVDLLESYYRSRGGNTGRGSYGGGCETGASPLAYLDYLQKVGHAYATLPLRMLSQLYGGYGYQGRDCGPARPNDGLTAQPSRVCLSVKGQDAFGHFKVQGSEGEEVTISFDGFKDPKAAKFKVFVRDEVRDWHAMTKGSPFDLDLDDCECRTISIKVDAIPASTKGCFEGKLKLTGESGVSLRVKFVCEFT